MLAFIHENNILYKVRIPGTPPFTRTLYAAEANLP